MKEEMVGLDNTRGGISMAMVLLEEHTMVVVVHHVDTLEVEVVTIEDLWGHHNIITCHLIFMITDLHVAGAVAVDAVNVVICLTIMDLLVNTMGHKMVNRMDFMDKVDVHTSAEVVEVDAARAMVMIEIMTNLMRMNR